MAEATGGEPQPPEELVLWEILTCLPSKSVLRCRAVCRSWRHLLTSDRAFLLAHHRRQPALQLVTITVRDLRIDALDHCAGELRPVARADRFASHGDLRPLAVCDGLLVVSAYRTRHICNPATRQRATLPLLRGFNISGLYLHCPSGSYRVLCWNRTRFPNDGFDLHGGRIVYYVHTVGSSELRRVGEPPEQWSWKVSFKIADYCYPHTLVQGRFYWRPIELPSTGSRKPNNMLVFDTVAESFQHVQTPVEAPCADPFELKGELGLYGYNGHLTADLWVLEDYEKNIWSFKYKIKLELPMFSLVPDSEGDVFVISRKKGCDVGILKKCLKHLSYGSVATMHDWNNIFNLTRHRFKESLVQHDFFPPEGNGGVDEMPLFHGLSTAVVLPIDNSDY